MDLSALKSAVAELKTNAAAHLAKDAADAASLPTAQDVADIAAAAADVKLVADQLAPKAS